MLMGRTAAETEAPILWPPDGKSRLTRKDLDTGRHFPGDLDGKESACNAGDPSSIPGSGRFPGKGIATHSSILVWRIPWTEKPGGL